MVPHLLDITYELKPWFQAHKLVPLDFKSKKITELFHYISRDMVETLLPHSYKLKK